MARPLPAPTIPAPAGTVSFTAGSSTATVTVDPTPDATVEPDETVILTVTAGAGYNVASPAAATGTIANDDSTLTVGTEFATDDATHTDSPDNTLGKIIIRVNGANLEVTNRDGVLLSSQPISPTNLIVNVTGRNNASDDLVIDGSVVAAGLTVIYNGGTETTSPPVDVLEFTGTQLNGQNLTISMTGAEDGTLDFGNNGVDVTFHEIEPLLLPDL